MSQRASGSGQSDTIAGCRPDEHASGTWADQYAKNDGLSIRYLDGSLRWLGPSEVSWWDLFIHDIAQIELSWAEECDMPQ